jgi:hypothetical protein
MYRRFGLTCAALALCATGYLARPAAAADVMPVHVELNIADVMRQIGDGIAYLLGRHDETTRTLVAKSLPQLQVDLSHLAAAKKGVLVILRRTLADTSAADRKANAVHISEADGTQLSEYYKTIRGTLSSLNADMRRMDPAIGAKDTKLTEDLFSRFMSQGDLTNQLGQLMDVKFYNTGEDYSGVSDRDKIAAFVAHFDTVHEIERLNARISAMRNGASH